MDKFSTRRRLLRGSLSAPLVLTVTSAGANVRTTFGACFDRADGHTPKDDDRLIEKYPSDMWYRKRVWMKKVYKEGKTDFFIPAPAGLNSGKYYKLNGEAAPYSLASATPENLPWGATNHKEVDALCFFDDKGYEVGWHWEENYGKCVPKSCYASVFGTHKT